VTINRTWVDLSSPATRLWPYDQDVDLPSAKTRRLIIVSALALAAILSVIAVLIYQSNPATTDLPVAIQAVEPEAGSNVLSQSDVLVDLAVGYTAEIDINGVEIPESQLFRVQALNSLSYQPREGKVVPRLPGCLGAANHLVRDAVDLGSGGKRCDFVGE